MSFQEYVVRRRITDTLAGDFVSDAKCDTGFPDARTWRELEAYLRSQNACAEAVTAARAVWRGYRAAQQRAEKVNA